MDCRQIKQFLDENFVATGFDLPDDIAGHVKDCGYCRDYYEELISLSASLDPIAEVSMTPDETAQFESGLFEAIEETEIAQPSYVPEGRVFSIARMALAAAAVLLMMVTSFNPDFPAEVAIMQNTEELQLTSVEAEDVALMFDNGDGVLIPSMLEDQSASFLTSQMQPGQAEDILDDVTAEELEWLMENLTMEI